MLKILLTVTILHYSLCINPSSVLYKEIFTYHDDTYSRAEYAYQVVQKIFNAFRQWFFTITFCEFTYYENRILKYTETFGDGYPVMLLNGCQDPNTTKVKPKIDKHGQTAYLVTANELTIEVSETVVEALIRTRVFKPRSAVIFVISIPVEVDSYFHYSMISHFDLLWSRRITNSILVIWSNKLRMFTYNPFKKEIMDITDVKDITRLLSKQYNNLYGHELRLSVFRKIYTSDETGPIYCNSNLAITVLQQLNATCLPLVPRDGNTVGDLLDNGTATGVTADLIDGYSDLELSSRILKNSYYGYIDNTYPLIQDELCYLIKKSIKQSTFRTTFNMISTNMFILFIFNVITFTAISIAVRKVEANLLNIKDNQTAAEVLMDMVKCFIRQTLDIKFVGPIFRCIVLLIMIYSLVVDCAIDGIITSAIAYPRFKPDINTLDELLEANLTLAVHNRHMNIFKKSISPERFDLVMERTQIFNDRMIKDAIEKRQFQYAILLRRSDANYISRRPANMHNGRPLFHKVEECPVPCSIVYGLRYGSPYLPKLDNILNHLNQGGILQHWGQSDEYTLFRTQSKALYAQDSKERKSLSVENLKEVFIVWSIGLLISTIAFLLEIVYYIVY